MGTKRGKRRRKGQRGGRRAGQRRLLVAIIAVTAVAGIGLLGVWRVSRPTPETAFRFPTPVAGRPVASDEIEASERAQLESILAEGQRKREPPRRER